MADDFDFINAQNWSDAERELWGGAFGESDTFFDPVAQALFNEGYFNFDLSTEQIGQIRDTLHDYLIDEYGIDFDQVFDWEAYREAYSEM
jgi:hypothetical protein